MPWIAPMLATLAEGPFCRQGWLFEPKLDGIRCLATRDGGEIELLSRNRKNLNAKYPELVAAFRRQSASRFTVDGEIVAFAGPLASFPKLQRRMQIEYPSPELCRDVPVWFYAFDLLSIDGQNITRMPLRERKARLRQALSFADPVRFVEHRETDGEAFYHEACSQGWEGIIAKDAGSLYVSRRTRDWLKFKCVQEQEFVIGGYTDPAGSRVGFGALLVGYYKGGQLMYAGKAGTGFDVATLQRLIQELKRRETAVTPFADSPRGRSIHWVKPDLVAQLGFSEWTTGGKLRHPRFLGLRSDKEPRDVIREKKIV